MMVRFSRLSVVGSIPLTLYIIPALIFFKELFLKCNDRAILVKSWLPEQPSETEMWLDQIVYDRALELVSRVY